MFGNLIKLLFNAGSKIIVDNIFKVFAKKVGD